MSSEDFDDIEHQVESKKESWYDKNFKTLLTIGLWIGFSVAIWFGLHLNTNVDWSEGIKILVSVISSGIFLLLIKIFPSFH